MIQLASKTINIEQFITKYGDNERFKLIDGELVEMEPTGAREQVAPFISRKLNNEET